MLELFLMFDDLFSLERAFICAIKSYWNLESEFSCKWIWDEGNPLT